MGGEVQRSANRQLCACAHIHIHIHIDDNKDVDDDDDDDGSDLFIGIGGSGRQSATRLAAFMADFDLFMIEITKNYTATEWREDMKKVSCVCLCMISFSFLDICSA